MPAAWEMQKPKAGHAAPFHNEEVAMTHGIAYPRVRTHRFVVREARDTRPLLSGTPYREYLRYKLKTTMEVAFITTLVAWAFLVPLFKDSLFQAIESWLGVP